MKTTGDTPGRSGVPGLAPAGSPCSPGAVSCSVVLPEDIVEAIVERVAEIVLDRLEVQLAEVGAGSPYLTIREAAEFLRCSRQRVDDLLSQRRLSRVKDGRRTLVLRAEIEAYLAARQLPRRCPPAGKAFC